MQLSDVFGQDELVANGNFSTLGQSDSAHPETLAYCDSVHHLRRADANGNVTCLISTPGLVEEASQTEGLVISDNPRLRFFQLHTYLLDNRLQDPEMTPGIGAGCRIHPTAVISESACIGDDVEIGAHTVIHDHVSIGSGTFVDSGAQIGVEGLLYYRDAEGRQYHARHQGGVRIGSQCAVLSQAVIVRSVHRGLLTQVGDHCILGVACNIGHEAQLANNVVVSNHCVIARAARLAVGSHIGTASVVREYVSVAENALVKPGSIVVDDVAAGQSVSGNYAISHREHLRDYTRTRRQCTTTAY